MDRTIPRRRRGHFYDNIKCCKCPLDPFFFASLNAIFLPFIMLAF